MLRDLRALLVEAKQKVPPFLMQLDEISVELLELGGETWSCSVGVRGNVCMFVLSCSDEKGCSYCGGLGHRITECPKLEAIQMKETGRIGKKDYLAGSSADW